MEKEMQDKIIDRLKDLYKNRFKIEKKFIISLRYVTDNEQIQDSINSLSELRGRIYELEYFLTQDQVAAIKLELGVDLISSNFTYEDLQKAFNAGCKYQIEDQQPNTELTFDKWYKKNYKE